jgi:tetracycline 7-halogenase / FADH2 O2-dependent halogenase
MTTTTDYDVIILGTGIGGTMLGAVLARQGIRVLLIDSAAHPRFAVGEATTPDTSFRLKILSAKYDVPEIANLSAFHKLRDNVSPACGVKRSFSFLYQREGQEQNPKESHQYPTLAAPMGPDCHFFRQDTDAYMLAVAVSYGAETRQQTRVTDFEIAPDHISVTTEKGQKYTAQYLVDAAGYRSPVAVKLGLRGNTEEFFKTNSRSMFTHMVNVKMYDVVGADPKEYELKYPLSQGTLHHVIDGGWFWVIPFNNHVDSTNPLCSVGLTLDCNKYPESGMDAEEEFFQFVNRYPSLKRQFENARAVRNWVTTPRLQYCSTQTVGDRYALLCHAAGFIDPLFSPGMNLTASSTDLLARHLLQAFRETGDFSREAFKLVEDRFQYNLKYFDRVVGTAFMSFGDFDLWDAWFRVWVVGVLVATELNANLYMRYQQTGDVKVLDDSGSFPYAAVLGAKFEEHAKVYDAMYEEIERYERGEIDAKTAADRIRRGFKGLTYVPTHWRWDDPTVRTTPTFTLWGMTRMYFWYYFKSPKAVRNQLFNWSAWTAYKYIFKSILDSYKASRSRKHRFVRDVFKAWNKEWRPKKTLEPAAKVDRQREAPWSQEWLPDKTSD